MVIIFSLLPIWTFLYFLLGIPAAILAEVMEDITGVYLMNEIIIVFFLYPFYWLILLVKNNDAMSEGDILFRNLQIIILTFLLIFPIVYNYDITENFYMKYFSMLLPMIFILLLANRREIKRLLN